MTQQVASFLAHFIDWLSSNRQEDDVTSTKKRMAQIALGAGLFVAGIAAGSLHARSVAGQNRFGQPKTVLHVVIYKFKDATSNNDRESRHQRDQRDGGKNSRDQECLDQDGTQPDQGFQRHIRD